MIKTVRWNYNISLDNFEDFQVAINRLLQSNCRGVILNLDQVSYMNSRALGIIASAVREAEKNKKELVISNIEASISRIFKVVHFDTIVRVFSNELEARKYFKETFNFNKQKVVLTS